MNEHRTDPEILTELLQGMHACMLTTMRNGSLRSRPMGILPHHYDGEIWFLTSRTSDKIVEIQNDPRVNVTYMDSGAEKYVSVYGSAEIVSDEERQEEMWVPIAKAWFDGPEDPNVILIKVNIEGAEYWNTPGGAMVAMFNMLKMAFTGNVADPGENRQLQLSDRQFESAERAAKGTGATLGSDQP